MARNLLTLISALTLLLIAFPAMANEPAAAPDGETKTYPEHPPHHAKASHRKKMEGEGSMREKNMERWQKMSPERREVMRRAARERVEQMQSELNALIAQAGGDELDPERRKQIQERYFDARRELENNLRRQMDETRKEELPKILEAIKAEFGIE